MTTVTVQPLNLRIGVGDDEPIVDGIRRHGLRARYKCRRGGCGACKCPLLAGTVRYDGPLPESVLSPAERAAGFCLPCRAIPTSNVVIDVGTPNLPGVLASTTRVAPGTTKEGPQCQ